MKHFMLVVFFVLLHGTLYADVQTQIDVDSSATTACRILRQTETGLDLENTISNLNLSEFTRPEGSFVKIDIPGYVKGSGANGAPDLPMISLLIEIPQKATVSTHILDLNEKSFALNDIAGGRYLAPRQPAHSKSIASDEPFFAYDPTVYNTDAVLATEKIRVDILGTMRGVRMARVSFSPFSYNPKTNRLTVAGRMAVRLTFETPDLALTNKLKARYQSTAFDKAYTRLANFKSASPSKDTVIGTNPDYPLTYVVVASNTFLNSVSLQDFIAWKRSSGYHVIEANTNDIFTSSTPSKQQSNLKSYLQNLYDESNTPPTYILFVGDVDQIPPFTITNIILDGSHLDKGHYTDLYYCDYTGDGLPDAYYGRFPVESVTELNSIVAKTLNYETYTMADDSYLDACMLIAGADITYSDTYTNGQVSYLINEYFNTDSGFSDIYAFLYNQTWNWDGTVTTHQTGGSNLVTGYIISTIRDGVGFVNYTGHCSDIGWYNKVKKSYELESNSIPYLNNSDRYGFFVGNCCDSSRLGTPGSTISTDSFGEKLVLADQEGAVAYIGAGNETFWDEDFYWAVGYKANIWSLSTSAVQNLDYSNTGHGNFDALWHTHNEDKSQWYTTAGQMVYCGNLAVMENSADYAVYYWEVYNIMGDPSMSPYLTKPEILAEPVIDPITPCTDTELTLTTEPDALVALSRNNEFLDSSWSGSTGEVTLSFPPISSSDDVELVITKQNRRPVEIPVGIGPFPDVDPMASFLVGSDAALDSVNVISGRPVTFINTSSGCPESYEWTITGATPDASTAKSPTVTYTDLGTYTVSLTATNPSGSNPLTRTNYIQVLPAINFSADQTHIIPGTIVTFTDQSSHPATAWEWTFQGGEPATSTEQNPEVLFDTVGIYTVTLTATVNGADYPATKASYIIVIDPDSDKNTSGSSPTPGGGGGCFIETTGL